MVNLVDVFAVIRSVEFLSEYETDEERKKALKKIQSDAFSFFSTVLWAVFVCLIVTFLKVALLMKILVLD